MTDAERLRQAWEAQPGERLLGIVGRVDPAKGQHLFIQAAAQMAAFHPEARFVVVGRGSEQEVTAVRRRAEELGIGKRVRWVGYQSDMVAVFNALDVLVSASETEGFSNVIGEAMACGVPCVVTDVGDSAAVVGDTGWVVTERTAPCLATAIVAALEDVGGGRSVLARSRIVSRYGPDRMVDATLKALGL